MSNHKNTLYLLETNNRHEIESFKIINYFDVNELTFKENKTSEGFPKFGKLTISINDAYEVIDVEDKQKGNILQSKRKEYGRNKTSVQKYYLVMEDKEGEQYLYSTKSFNYLIDANDRIVLNDATKTKFDLLIQSLESKEDFEKRVDALNKKLGNLKKNTSTLFSSFKKGGGIEDITIDKPLRQKFMNMIENYITCVNEVLNLPFFKKLFYASTSSPFILSDGEVFNRLKKFHYINLYFKTNNEFIDFEDLDDNFKFLFLGLKPGGSSDLIKDKIDDISKHTSIIAKNDKEIKTIIKSKYSQSDLTSNYKSIPIYYFANSILQDIRDVAVGKNSLKYEQFFTDKKYIEFKNRIMEFMYFILEIIETETKYMLELLYKDIDKFESGKYDSPVYKSVEDKENMDKINDFVKDKMEVTMLTYLKIRNDQHNEIVVDNLSNEDLKLYNARFFLKLHKPEIDSDPIKMIEVNYSDDNEKYYEENESEKMKAITLNKKPINLHLYKSFEDDEGSYDINPSTRFSQNKYPHKYLFGEFNNIFKPDLNNSQIAERTEEVINNLLSDKPVFMIGYGASGAGKTSTLIYFNKAKTDGILIELCKIMGSKGYTSLNVKTCELYQDSNIYKKENVEEDNKKMKQTGSVKSKSNIQTVKTDEHNFTYEEELGFVSNGKIEHKNHHIYRVFKTNKENNDLGDDDTCNAETFKVFPKNTNLGEYLIYVIDTDRHVKATTNNINSSRSHSLIFVEMKNDDNKTAHLVVGDFAGVENEFNCDNPQVLDNFMQIKKDDGSLFYKEEVCEDDIDPIGFSVKRKEQIQGGEGEEKSSYNINEEYINKFKTIFNEKPYNFENCDIDELNKEENFSDILFKEDSKADQQTHFRNSVRILRKAANIDLNTKTNQEYNPLSEARFKNIRNLNLTPYRIELKTYNDTIENMKKLVTSNRDIAKQRTLMAEISSILSYSAETAKSSHGKKKSFRNSQTIINSNGITLENTSLFYNLKFQSKINEFPYSKFGLQQRLFYFIEYYFLRKASFDLKEEIKKVSVINSTITKEDQAFITMNRIAKYYTGKDIPALDYIRDFPLPSDGKITYEIENVPNFIYHFKKALDNKKPKQEDKFESEKTKLFQNISILKKLPNILKEKSPSNQEIIFNYFEKNSIFSQINENGDLRTEFQDSINYVNYILDDKYSNFLFNLEAYTYQQQALAISVCDNRKIEGYFINNSLAEIREIIKEIIKRKNDGVNSILPNYLDICFERYCPTHKNCFSFTDKKKNEDSTNEVQSAIFNVIQEYFATKTYYQIDDYNEVTEKYDLNINLFYQKLVIGIFCVLNISKKANNPPPVPYVDINDLKRIVFNYNLFTDKNKNELKLEFTRLARNLIYSIENKYIDTYKNGNKIEKRNLLQEIKQSKELDNFKIKINKLQEDNTLYTEINLYTFFKYILNILLPSDELIDKEEEIKLKIDSLTDDLETELQQYNLVDQLHQFNNKRITHLQQLKKNIARKYRLKSLTRLVHFLEVDKIRLDKAKKSTFSYARDGYDPRIIYERLNPTEKENFKSGYGLTKDDIELFYSLDARNPNQETQRENIYVSIREYIQSNIQKLYSEVFVDNNFLLTEVFDIEQSNLQFGFSGEDSNESITLEALDNINEYISKHISYFRSDAFNEEKMQELLTIIDDFKTAINHLSKISEKAEKEIQNIEDSLNILPNISDVKETTGVSQEDQFNTKQTEIQNKIDELRKTLIPFQENNENLVKLNKQILNLNQQKTKAKTQRDKGFLERDINKADNEILKLKTKIEQEKPEKQKIEQEIDTLQEQLNQNQSGFEKSYGDSEEGKNKQKLDLKQKIGVITENLMKQIDRLKNPLPEDSQRIKRNKNKSKKVVNDNADYCMDLLEKFLISIDNNNSASAIGTLEFIDKMAKLNSVANICNFSNETLNQQDFYKEFNKSGYQLVPLYEKDKEEDNED